VECAYWETAASAGAGIIPPRAKGARPWQWEAAPEDGFHVLRHTSVVIVLEAGGGGDAGAMARALLADCHA
jgi:hypothetical protein